MSSAGEEVLLFRQQNFLSEDFALLELMRKQGVLCDVTIKVKNRSLRAHRLVLATGIPLFRAMLVVSTAGSKKREIICDEVDPETMESFITYAYTSKIDITTENVESIISGSKYLHLRRVRDACYNFLASNLHLSNLLKVRTLAVDHDCFFLVENVDTYIRDNFVVFCNTSDFLELKHHYLKKLLSSDDLNVPGEEDVFQALLRWVKFSPEERRPLLPELLQHVRMTRLSPEFLVEHVSTEDLVQNCSTSRDMVDEVKNYHLSPQKSSALTFFTSHPRGCHLRKSEHMLRRSGFGPGLYAVCYSQFRRRIVKCFDPNIGEWMTVSNCSRHKRYSTILAGNGKIYDVGGKSIEVFNLQNLEWSPVVLLNKQIFNAGLVFYGDKIYLFGGHDLPNSIRCYDLFTNKWLKEGEMPTCRLFSGVASLKDYIYVTGGTFADVTLCSAEKYHPLSEEWVQISPMLDGRWGHGCTAFKGCIYVCGGKATQNLRSVEAYNPVPDQWTVITPMNGAKILMSLAACNESLFAIGGLKEGKQPVPDVEMYDPDFEVWRLGNSVCHKNETAAFVRAVAVSPV